MSTYLALILRHVDETFCLSSQILFLIDFVWFRKGGLQGVGVWMDGWMEDVVVVVAVVVCGIGRAG